MTECRKRISSAGLDGENTQPKHDPDIFRTFTTKLFEDCQKLYNYDTYKIKWINEPPKARKAYEPTEVSIYLNDQVYYYITHDDSRQEIFFFSSDTYILSIRR
jgi:hypothetical protein